MMSIASHRFATRSTRTTRTIALCGGAGPGEDHVTERRRVELSDVVGDAFGEWLTDWRLWADRERRDAEVRDIYKELFAIHLASTDHSEEFELVLGVGYHVEA